MPKTALITGASSGIGAELARIHAKRGGDLVIIARREDKLKALGDEMADTHDVTVHILPMDLNEEDAPQKIFDWVQTKGIKIDYLINNAGFGTYGYAGDIPIDRERQMIQLNVLNLYTLTRLFMDEMIKRDAGTIINISSNTSFQPVPKMSAYAATKAFVKHYSLSLHEELKALNSAVRVITICPSAISNTPFKKVANMNKVKTFEGLVATTKEEVAEDVWRAFEHGKHYMPSGSKLRRTLWLSKLMPHSLVQFMLRRELSE